MSKKEIVAILVRRDGISENEAWEIVDNVQDEIEQLIADAAYSGFSMYEEAVDILASELGLEPDYLDAFLL